MVAYRQKLVEGMIGVKEAGKGGEQREGEKIVLGHEEIGLGSTCLEWTLVLKPVIGLTKIIVANRNFYKVIRYISKHV